MVLPLITSLHTAYLPRLPYVTRSSRELSSNARLPCQVRCMESTQVVAEENISRRSGNWPNRTSDYDFVQSLKNEYVGESYVGRADKLKADVRIMLDTALSRRDQLELVDILQRIGLAYHFEDQITFILKRIFNEGYRQHPTQVKENLYVSALEFRLLRQHGYKLSPDIFNNFKDEEGHFKTSLGDDIEGMLSLYEASYLLIEGESVLEDAREFAVKHLKEDVEKTSKDQYLSMLVSHTLQLPLHWRMPRMEARWFMDVYERRQDFNPIILELAKLDFNMVQAQHQDELKDLSRWWNDLDLSNKLFYSRERTFQNALFAVGEQWEPRFGYYRKWASRVNALITTIDDAYDVYGTLEEVEILTDVVDGWDMNTIDRLPDFLKISFLALFNSINDIAYFILKEKGVNVVPSLKKLWGDLCRAYLQEARWFHSGYTPTLEEYLETAWVSISGHVILGHAFLLVTDQLTPEITKCYMENGYPDAVRFASTILRLANDLATSSDEIARGDVPKSIQCYMHETGATEEEARQHIRSLIDDTWKKLNKERYSANPYSITFMETALNLARASQCCYEFGDGYGFLSGETKDRLFSLFVHPIPVPNSNKTLSV